VKVYTVHFAPECEEQLTKLFNYIKDEASPQVAAGYVSAIVDYCENLAAFPLRGTPRNDLRPGVRITTYKRRATVAYTVADDQVLILAVFYGGQDYEAALSENPDV